MLRIVKYVRTLLNCGRYDVKYKITRTISKYINALPTSTEILEYSTSNKTEVLHLNKLKLLLLVNSLIL